MSAERDESEARRAALVARAAGDRDSIVRQLAPLRSLDRGLTDLAGKGGHLPKLIVGAGLGLSAMVLALPSGGMQWFRSGVALLHLAGSVRRLFSRRGTP